MNKKIKVIELLNLLAENKIKRGTRIKYGNYTYKIDYPNLCGIYIEGGSTGRENSLFSELDICALNYDVEILEDEEETDIQELEDVNLFDNGQNFNDMPIIIKSYDDNFTNINNTINKLVQAVKQLDKKINKED